MANLNSVVLIGNLVRDPELRYTPSGSAVSEFPIALNRRFKTKSGEKKEEVTFIDVVSWNRQAELCAQYLKKGRSVCVSGHLTQDRWEDKKTGQKRSTIYVTAENVQFLTPQTDRTEVVPAVETEVDETPQAQEYEAKE